MKMTYQQTPENDAACSLLSLINAANHIEPTQDNHKNNELQRPTTPCESVPVHLMTDNQSAPASPCATSARSHDAPPAMLICQKKSAKVQFPMILMSLLDEPSNSDVATFLPDGKSFTILRPKAFASELLPRYFRMTKFSSFVRKLYRWGFRQVNNRSKPGSITYHHPLFRRGDLSLCQRIKCQKSDNKPSSSISPAPGQSQPVLSTVRQAAICQPEHPRKLIEQRMQQQQEVSPTRVQPLSPASQPSVNDATKTVLKAALEVLNKDSALPSSTTVDLDQMTRQLLGSSKISRRSGMLNVGLSARSNFLLGRPLLGGSSLMGLTVGRSIMPDSLNDFGLKM